MTNLSTNVPTKLPTAVRTRFRAGVFVACAGLALSGQPASAQKGMGEATGVARQADKPTVQSFAGTVENIEIAPCKRTTGRFVEGVHVKVQMPDRIVDVHLGPSAALEDLLDQITTTNPVSFEGFRTDQMPENTYVAKTFTLGGTTYELRDDALRPNWAIGGRGGRRGGAPSLDVGPGWQGSKGACYW
ncbi:hypothetical protein [Blastochloris sulfoviridis]|uniref:hypothetical protein n=1 Tax=Blastochloris sulfoviridis TaxID=50712 RepID=UPI001AEEF59B|nr:hypothetical protein [Blastochloris sulfoviridis]